MEKLGFDVDDESEISSKVSKLSRDSNKSKMCKIRDNYSCKLCGFKPESIVAAPKQLEAAHLYEIKELQLVPNEDRRSKLNKFGLDSINSITNLLTMCQLCHQYFDNQRIGIHPDDVQWIITTPIANTPSSSGELYLALNGKTVDFDFVPWPILEHRYNRFIDGGYFNDVVPRSTTTVSLSDSKV